MTPTALRQPTSLLSIGTLVLCAAALSGCTTKQEPAAPAQAASSAPDKAATTPAHPAEPAAAPAKGPGAVDAGKTHTEADHAAEVAAAKAAAAKATNEGAARAAAAPTTAPVTEISADATVKGSRTVEASGKAPEATPPQKITDPLSQDVDPNSKARLTYEFGSDSKNFGKVMQGDVLTHTFVLKSSGEEDLVIKSAKPTCGCTTANPNVEGDDGKMVPYTYGAPIKPGRKVEITATLHTQSKRGHAASRINIFSSDPRGQSQLGLEADVDPYFQINPFNLNFNTLSTRDTASDKVSVSTTRGEHIKLAATTDNVPAGMKLDLKPLDADADGKASRWELVATVGPGLNEGQLAYNVALKSDLPIPGGEKLPNGQVPTYEASVAIMARVAGMIEYNPAFVSLGLIRPGQVVSRNVRITCHDPEFKLTEPKVMVQGRDGEPWEFAPHFTSVIRPVTGEPSAIDVELRLDGMPESLNGSFSGVMVIQIGHPDKPEIKLPITGVCRGGVVTPVVTPPTPPTPAPPAPVNPPK